MITLLRILNDEPYGNGFQEVRRWQLRLPFLEVLFEVEQKLIPASLERLVHEQRLGGSPALGRRDGLDRAIRVALQHREITACRRPACCGTCRSRTSSAGGSSRFARRAPS